MYYTVLNKFVNGNSVRSIDILFFTERGFNHIRYGDIHDRSQFVRLALWSRVLNHRTEYGLLVYHHYYSYRYYIRLYNYLQLRTDYMVIDVDLYLKNIVEKNSDILFFRSWYKLA